MLIPNPTYDAFISYSREDAPLAAKFQAAVQGFARPWYRRRSLRLFRDMSNLSAAESLQRELEVALNNAKYLILLASPSAAASEWVNREISYWLSKKSIRTIILVKVNGTIQWDPQARDFCFDEGTAVPKSLQGVYGAEPIWVDLPASVFLVANRTESKRAIGQVVARIRGVELDQILGEDLRQQRRTWISVSAFSCLLVFLLLAGVVAYRQSLIEEKAKQQQALMAKSRLLALQSQAALEQKNDTLALQSALASFSIVTSPVSIGALVSALVETRHLDKEWRVLNANGNQPPVDAMALGGSVEQPLLITGDNKGAIAIYDRHSGQALQLFEAAHSAGVTDIAVSPDGFYAASGAFEGGFAIWDLRRLTPVYSTDQGPGFSLAFAPDGKRLLLGGNEGRLLVWDAVGQQVITSHSHPSDGTVTDIAVDLRGRGFITGGLYGVVRVWDLETLEPIGQIDPEPATGAILSLSPDGQMLAMAGGTAVQKWNMSDYESYGNPYISKGATISEVFYHRKNSELFIVDNQELIRWSLEVNRFAFHPQTIRAASSAGKSDDIASVDMGGRVRIWKRYPFNAFQKIINLPEAAGGANAIAISQDGGTLAVACSDARFEFAKARWVSTRGSVYRFDLSTGNVLGPSLEGHTEAIADLAWSRDGKLATASDDGSVRLWDVGQGAAELVSSIPDANALDIEFSPDGKSLAFAYALHPAQVWDLDQKRVVYQSPVTNINSVTFSPDGRILALGTQNGDVLLWKPTDSSNSLEPVLQGAKTVNGLAFNGQQQLIALAANQVVQFDLNQNTITRWAHLQESTVRSLAVANGNLATLSISGQLGLWDLNTMESVAVLASGSHGFMPVPQQVSSSVDGTLIAVTNGAEVSIYDLSPQALQSRACYLLKQPGTEAVGYEPLCPIH